MIPQEKLDEIDKIVDAETARFINDLPNLIKTRLEERVAECLGFEVDHWTKKWKVRSFRDGMISNYISNKARDLVTSTANEIGLKFNISKDLHKAMHEAYQSELRNHNLRQKATEYVKEKIESVLLSLITNAAAKPINFTIPSPEEAADSNFGETELQKILLDELAKQHK